MTQKKAPSNRASKDPGQSRAASPRKRVSTETSIGKLNIRDMVQALTGGRPFVFVIMGYNARHFVFKEIKRVVEAEGNIACIRADNVKSSGHDLLEKIHHLIAHAEFVIAEISDATPNVFYEIGYAMGIQTPPLLLIEGEQELPTDLKGQEIIRYRQTQDGTQLFETELRAHIRGRLASNLSLFRDMLQAPEPHPAYIVASPKYPGAHSRIAGQVFDGRTFGDHLGILGLLSAFGSMWGERNGVELISAQHAPLDLLDFDLNLYLIGSDKSNPHTPRVLKSVQASSSVAWFFDPLTGFTRDDTDWPCVLYRRRKSGRNQAEVVEPMIGTKQRFGSAPAEIWTEDYGLIVRGVHPAYKNRRVLILAGAHSLGTGAACLAATRSDLLQKLKNALPEGTLEDRDKAFWVLVKGKVSTKDKLLDPEGVSIVEAGLY